MNGTDTPCTDFRPTHPEAASASPLLACALPVDEPGDVGGVVIDTGVDTIWLAPADVEPFIEWLRACA